MKPTITEVYCYYTGGNIYTYSAKYGDAFLYGTLNEWINCLTVRGEILYEDEAYCEEFGWTDEMNSFRFSGCESDYYIDPIDIEYPTWSDILDSLHHAECLAEGVTDAETILKECTPDLTKRTYE